MPQTIKYLKLKPGKLFLDTATNLAIKQGEPVEYPNNAIVIITFPRQISLENVSFTYYVYSSLEAYLESKKPIKTQIINLFGEEVTAIATIPTDGSNINLGEKSYEQALNYIIQATADQDGATLEYDEYTVPDPIIEEPNINEIV